MFDFGRYITPPAYIEADRQYVDEPVEWAAVRDGVLYVANFHRTYARSSKGLNAFLTAIDIGHAQVLWRSRPLVSNANNFVVLDDVIVTGYGFTAEPDYLYVINRTSGAIVQTVRLRSAPEYILLKGTKLFVRSYDTDYVFSLVGR